MELLEKNVKYVVLSVIIVNFETYFTPFCSVSIADSEQVNVDWEYLTGS